MKNNFKFITKDNVEIKYYIDKLNNKWFDALIVIEYLEYEEPKEILKNNKIKKYIKKYDEIFNDSKNKSNLKIISESGIFRLLLNSNQKEALVFQDWLVDDVLMNLQKNNEYVIIKQNIVKYLT